MNKKIVRGGVAGIAVLALAAGGSTFAGWSDSDVLSGSQAGAEELALVLNEPNSQDFNNMKLAPGVGNDFEFVVTSRTGTTITGADLSMALENLVGTEDGCTSTNSEKEVDNNCDNGNPNNEGEFIEQAVLGVNTSQPTTDVANACDSSIHPRGQRQPATPLAALEGQTIDLLPSGVDLTPNEGICVAMGLNMPASADNASQGDSGAWDLKFMLEQAF